MTSFPDSVETDSDRDSRRQRLAVLCALDRVELRLALRPRPAPPAAESNGGNGLRSALNVAAFLPGPIGRWSRRIAVGLRVMKGLGSVAG